jgi:hypothetical protein
LKEISAMRRTRALLVAILASTSAPALADVTYPGYVGVLFSLRVTGQIAQGKAAVVANTMSGAEPLPPDTVTQVRWHPVQGPMRLVLVDAIQLRAVELAKTQKDR